MTLGPLPIPSSPMVNGDGTPALSFLQYFQILDQLIRGFTGGNPGLINAANDGAAAAAGVQIGQLYRNGNAVQIRLV